MERRRQPGESRRYRRRPYRMGIASGGTSRGGVLIGLDEMYDLLVDVHEKVTELSRDHEQSADRINRVEKTQAQQQAEIRQLQRWAWMWAGGAAVAGGILARIIDIGGTP